MSDVSITQLSQLNNSGTARELHIPKLKAEVMAAFKRANIMEDKHMIETISSGSSAVFHATGVAKAGFYTFGQDLTDPANQYLSQVKTAKVQINIDQPLISTAVLDRFDMAQCQTDARSKIMEELGRALAVENDKRLLQVGVLGARDTKLISDTSGYRPLSGGTVLELGATAVTTASVLRAGIESAAARLIKNDIDLEGAFCVLRPDEYFLLRANTAVVAGGWNQVEFTGRELLPIAGIQVFWSNNLPSTSISAVSGEKNTYNGDFSDTIGLVFHKFAIGEVRLLGLDLTIDRIPHLANAHLATASQECGFKALRPEALIELSKASAT